MSESVFILLEIPFASRDGQADSIRFHRWLPMLDSDEILINDTDTSYFLRFDSGCTHSRDLCDEARLSNWANPSVFKVIAEARVQNVSEALIQEMQEPPDLKNASHEWLHDNPHRNFAIKIVNNVLIYVNRLISYARHHKGQYNLGELSLDPDNLHSALIQFKARIKIGESEWIRWSPPGIGGVWTEPAYPGDRRITKEDWPSVKNYVASKERLPLLREIWVRELLAGAEYLADHGHERAALTEAVTALEVAIHKFARQPNAQAAFGSLLAARMNVSTLTNQIKHLGLSGSIRYLLPVVFPEERLSTEILRGCAEAIEERQNVVHNGKRTIEATKLTRFLASIRELCLTLEKYEVGAGNTDEPGGE